MEKPDQELRLAELVADLTIEFLRPLTVGTFVEELKGKMRIFDQKRDQKVNAANLDMINSYAKEIEAGLPVHLYEFQLTLKKKSWRSVHQHPPDAPRLRQPDRVPLQGVQEDPQPAAARVRRGDRPGVGGPAARAVAAGGVQPQTAPAALLPGTQLHQLLERGGNGRQTDLGVEEVGPEEDEDAGPGDHDLLRVG